MSRGELRKRVADFFRGLRTRLRRVVVGKDTMAVGTEASVLEGEMDDGLGGVKRWAP